MLMATQVGFLPGGGGGTVKSSSFYSMDASDGFMSIFDAGTYIQA
jgi:hypothetical protein